MASANLLVMTAQFAEELMEDSVPARHLVVLRDQNNELTGDLREYQELPSHLGRMRPEFVGRQH